MAFLDFDDAPEVKREVEVATRFAAIEGGE
jgi:hypothetical protein